MRAKLSKSIRSKFKNKKVKDKVNVLLRQIIKFNLPSDYPDELIDTHLMMLKNNFNISKEKIKNILKISQSKK